MSSLNSFGTRSEIRVGGAPVDFYSLPVLERTYPGVARLPFSLKILLENLLRREDDAFVKADDIRALAQWNATANVEKEISFMPARVLLQDFTGVPCVVDLAAMRDAVVTLGGDPDRVNPLRTVELVIDHSVQVDYFGRADAFALNAELEFSRNRERYAFLRWGQRAFNNFQVVPPDTGIVHQVNIERLARVVFSETVNGRTLALSRHAGRHRLAHHDGQRARRRGLGRRRHRGRGGDAGAAQLDADSAGARRPADRQRCRAARPPPTWCSPSPRRCARWAWSASSSSSSARA